jgi:hypothetical protein
MVGGCWRLETLPKIATTAVKGLEMVDHGSIIRQRPVPAGLVTRA